MQTLILILAAALVTVSIWFINWVVKMKKLRAKEAKILAAAMALNKAINKKSKRYVGIQSAFKAFNKFNRYA